MPRRNSDKTFLFNKINCLKMFYVKALLYDRSDETLNIERMRKKKCVEQLTEILLDEIYDLRPRLWSRKDFQPEESES